MPPRRNGTPPVKLCGHQLTEPSHICAFFDSYEERMQTLTPYAGGCVEAGHRLLDVVEEEHHAAHLDMLRALGPAAARALGDRRLQLRIANETYLAGGTFDVQRMLDLVSAALQEADGDGRWLCTWGEMDWLERTPIAIDRVIEYEARVNEFLPDSPCTFVCVYDRRRVSGGVLADILATHPHAIINGVLRPNPSYVPAPEFLSMLRQRDVRGA